MALQDLKITVNDKEYRIKRKLIKEEPTEYELRVLDANGNELLKIPVESPLAHAFRETDEYIEKVIKTAIKDTELHNQELRNQNSAD